MGKANLFFGGIPTAPDVRKLIERFGAPEPGLIEHEAIEAIIECQRLSSRYRTILSAWRRTLRREHNIDSEAVPSEGIRILTEPERVDVSTRDFGRASRRVGRAHQRARRVEAQKLDDLTRHKHDHLIRISAMAVEMLMRENRELAQALKVPAQLPRAKTS